MLNSKGVKWPDLDLRRHYPISSRHMLMVLGPWILALAGTAAVVLITDVLQFISPEDVHVFLDLSLEEVAFLAGIFLILGAKYLYLVFYLKAYRYGVRANNVVISKGIFLKRRVCLPLEKITEIYCGTDIRHLLFGLCYVDIMTPAGGSGRFSRIEGLSKKTGSTLQLFLTQIVESRHKAEAPSRSASKMMRFPIEVPDFPAAPAPGM